MSKSDQEKSFDEENYNEAEHTYEEFTEKIKSLVNTNFHLSLHIDLDELTKFANWIDLQMIKPLIDNALGDVTFGIYNANSDHWPHSSSYYSHVKDILQDLEYYFTIEKIDSAIIYAHRRTWHDLESKLSKLCQYKHYKDAEPAYLIFMLTNDSKELDKFINRYNIDVNYKDNNGLSAAHYAAQIDNEQGLELLIDQYNFDVTAQDYCGNNILHYAASYGHTSLLTKILDNYNVDINSKNYNGDTCLHLALERRWPEVLAKLLKKNPDLTINNSDNLNPLSYAAKNGDLEALQMMISHLQEKQQFEVDKLDVQQHTLLYHAAHSYWGYNKLIVDYLVGELGADHKVDPVSLAGVDKDKCILS